MCRGWRHHHSLSLSSRQHGQLNNRETSPSGISSAPDTLNYRVGPYPGCPFKCLMCRSTESGPIRGLFYETDVQNNTEGPQARDPSKCLKGQRYRERLVKEAFSFPATRVLKKDSDRAITGTEELCPCPAHFVQPGSPQAKQFHHFHTQLSLGQSCHRQKKKKNCTYAHRVALVVSDSLLPYGLWPSRLLYQEGGFSRQEYWSILAKTGRHTLLEHYISCCPTCQPL